MDVLGVCGGVHVRSHALYDEAWLAFLLFLLLFAITPNKAIQPLKSKELHKGGNYENENLHLAWDITCFPKNEYIYIYIYVDIYIYIYIQIYIYIYIRVFFFCPQYLLICVGNSHILWEYHCSMYAKFGEDMIRIN